MRNDARPVGEEAHDKSPIDERDSVAHDRQSPVVNRRAEEEKRETDPTMPSDDATLNTKI